MSFLGDIRRQQLDIQRVASKSPQYPSMGQGMVLMKVISSTLITGSDKRYLYTLREAVVSAAPTYAPTQSVNLPQYFGLSVSELSNAGPTYSYGITAGNVPAGFTAVAIPTNSYCAAFPHYTTEGDVVFLIVNTQAIDGACNP
jgi:hypothetical protein